MGLPQFRLRDDVWSRRHSRTRRRAALRQRLREPFLVPIFPENRQVAAENNLHAGIRKSESHGSINRDGLFQSSITGMEAEVKDAQGEWKFYEFPIAGQTPNSAGKLLPAGASCYSCHAKNTAVENTFVQFYPTLMEVAERMGTVKKDYVR